MTYEFEIPGQLPGLNEIIGEARRSKFAGARQKKKTEELVMWAMVTASRNVKFKRSVTVSFHWYEPNLRRDPDNVTSGQKFVFDALVARGVLKGDSRKYVKQIFHHFHEPDKENPRVRVVVMEEAW